MKQQYSISDLISNPLGLLADTEISRRTAPMKGRGVRQRPPGRFETRRSLEIDDGWFFNPDDLPPASVPTKVHVETAERVISRNQSPDVPFDQSINPYRGCEHGCVYCYARPSHGYLNLSAGLDFETEIFAKTNAAEKLEQEILSPNYKCSPINLGANTDPYQPAEKQKKITRKILQVLEKHYHPVTIITKSTLILRDLDILERMAKKNLVSVAISVTTLQDNLKRTLEPRAASPKARIKTIRELSARGVPVTLLLAPIIPAINDHEIEPIVNACADAGVTSAHYIFLRLPFEVKELFSAWLFDHFPMRAKHVLNLIGASRNGKAYEAKFGLRMVGSGPYAQMIQKRFEKVAKTRRLQSREAIKLSLDLFEHHRPSNAQISLF